MNRHLWLKKPATRTQSNLFKKSSWSCAILLHRSRKWSKNGFRIEQNRMLVLKVSVLHKKHLNGRQKRKQTKSSMCHVLNSMYPNFWTWNVIYVWKNPQLEHNQTCLKNPYGHGPFCSTGPESEVKTDLGSNKIESWS